MTCACPGSCSAASARASSAHLPPPPPASGMTGARPEAGRGARACRRRPVRASSAVLALSAGAACGGAGPPPAPLPPGDYTPRHVSAALVMPAAQAARLRDDALLRARVWRPPEAIGEADLLDNPPRGFRAPDALACR